MSALLLVLSGVACGGSAPSGESATLPTAIAERDGIVVTLALDRAEVSPFERVWAIATARNVGIGSAWYRGAGCDVPIGVTANLEAAFTPGREWPGIAGEFKDFVLGGQPNGPDPRHTPFTPERFVDQGLFVCTGERQISELSPGATVTARAAWDAEMAEMWPAPPGQARVTASFPLFGRGQQPRFDQFGPVEHPVTVTTGLTITGEDTERLSPGEVVDAVLADGRFAAWLAGRPRETWINVNLYPAGDGWHLEAFRNPRAEFAIVRIDARTGALLELRFGTP